MSEFDAPAFLTWDGDPANAIVPRRPSVEDAGGDQKLDAINVLPPDPIEHATAAQWNQQSKQIAALARVAESCKLEIRFSSGAPFVQNAPSPGTLIALSTFTVVDNGTGDTSITWPAETFPPHACSPTGLTMISSSTSVVAGHLQEITNGIRVRTFVAGTPTDVPWTVDIN